MKYLFKERDLKEAYRKIKKRISIRLSDEITIKVLEEVDITPTLKCNLNCAMCHQHEIKHKENMKIKDFERLIPNLKRAGVSKVSLVGGEIFIMKDLWRFIEVLEKNKMRYDLATNATVFSEKELSLLKKLKYLEKISTSLDGNQEIHNKIRRHPTSYQRTINNIKKLLKEGIRVNVACVLQKANFKKIEQIIENFCKMGILDLSFLYEIRTDNEEKKQAKQIIKSATGRDSEIYISSLNNPLGNLSEKEIKSIPKKVESIKKIVEQYGGSIGFPIQLKDPSVLDKKIPLKNYTCSIFRGYNFTIYNDCNISFCPFINLEGNFNASKYNVKKIINSPPYKNLRKWFKKYGALSICRRCCGLTKKKS